MIIYQNNELKVIEMRSDFPYSDWTGKADYVLDDRDPNNKHLISKIFEYKPCFDYVTDDYGNLIDVVKNDVVLPEPELGPESEPIEDVSYDDLAAAIQEGVNAV